jgi:hypothetical protein
MHAHNDFFNLHDLCSQITWGRGAEGGMLLAEPNFLSRADRERLCQLMFEVFNLAGYYGADQAVLSMYALGRSSGTVIDIGHGKIGACLAPVPGIRCLRGC